MNYTIMSLDQVTTAEVQSNHAINDLFTDSEPQELHGTVYRISIEMVIDEVPLYMSFFCGSIMGVQAEHCQQNYNTVESFEQVLHTDIKTQLERDFPALINRNYYASDAQLAYEYLIANGIDESDLSISGSSLAIEIAGLTIHLTNRDIEYYSSL